MVQFYIENEEVDDELPVYKNFRHTYLKYIDGDKIEGKIDKEYLFY